MDTDRMLEILTEHMAIINEDGPQVVYSHSGPRGNIVISLPEVEAVMGEARSELQKERRDNKILRRMAASALGVSSSDEDQLAEALIRLSNKLWEGSEQ